MTKVNLERVRTMYNYPHCCFEGEFTTDEDQTFYMNFAIGSDECGAYTKSMEEMFYEGDDFEPYLIEDADFLETAELKLRLVWERYPNMDDTELWHNPEKWGKDIRETILEKIAITKEKYAQFNNWEDSFFAIGATFTEEELADMTEKELMNLYKLSEKISANK